MLCPFSENFAGARARFIGAVQAANVEVESFPHGSHGPDGEQLSTDVAWFGSSQATRVVVMISGTHGVEGFYGSATQIAWIQLSEFSRLPRDTAALLIHAINPYGFAWLRRSNEQNVDLNRNWIDFSKPLPTNPGYEELAEDLCPVDWSPESQRATGDRIASWIGAHGLAAYQSAVSSGQWQHPKGLFFGGTRPAWSRETLTEILIGRLKRARRVNILDFHTGLGPFGYAELISDQHPDDASFKRARCWIGASMTSVNGGGSVSSKLQGDCLSAIPGLLPHAIVDAIAIECGIKSIHEVAYALRADAWLHAYGDPSSDEANAIKTLICDAFHSRDPLWQGMAIGQGLAVCRSAIAGLVD